VDGPLPLAVPVAADRTVRAWLWLPLGYVVFSSRREARAQSSCANPRPLPPPIPKKKKKEDCT